MLVARRSSAIRLRWKAARGVRSRSTASSQAQLAKTLAEGIPGGAEVVGGRISGGSFVPGTVFWPVPCRWPACILFQVEQITGHFGSLALQRRPERPHHEFDAWAWLFGEQGVSHSSTWNTEYSGDKPIEIAGSGLDSWLAGCWRRFGTPERDWGAASRAS